MPNLTYEEKQQMQKAHANFLARASNLMRRGLTSDSVEVLECILRGIPAENLTEKDRNSLAEEIREMSASLVSRTEIVHYLESASQKYKGSTLGRVFNLMHLSYGIKLADKIRAESETPKVITCDGGPPSGFMREVITYRQG